MEPDGLIKGHHIDRHPTIVLGFQEQCGVSGV